MKTILISSILFLFILESNSQVYEYSFNRFIDFNVGMKRAYREIIDSINSESGIQNFSGMNKFIFDLNNKKVHRYFDGRLEQSADILELKKQGELLHMKITDIESLTNKKVVTTLVYNTDPTDKSNPRFLMYFVSTLTQTTNGSVVWNGK